RIEGLALGVALDPGQERAEGKTAHDDPPEPERGVLEPLGKRRIRDTERLKGLLRKLVEVVVQNSGEEERTEADGDRSVGPALEIAERHRACDRADGCPGEDDEVRSCREERVRNECHRGSDEDGRAPETLALALPFEHV